MSYMYVGNYHFKTFDALELQPMRLSDIPPVKITKCGIKYPDIIKAFLASKASAAEIMFPEGSIAVPSTAATMRRIISERFKDKLYLMRRGKRLFLVRMGAECE